MKFLLIFLFSLISIISCNKVSDNNKENLKIYHNGHIITMLDNDELLYANGVIVSNGTIKEVIYDNNELSNYLKDKNAEIIDLNGHTLMPSFIDSHSHLIRVAQSLTTVDLSGVSSIYEISNRINFFIKANNIKEGSWVIGFGYDNNNLEGKRNPNRDDLDAISTNYAIFITHISGHVGSMNSLALEKFGVNENTPDIKGGLIQRYPNSRKPTGYMEESAFIHYAQSIDFKLSDEDFMKYINNVEDIYLSYGITTAQDSLISKSELPIIKSMITNNRFRIDVLGYIDLKTSPSLYDENKDLIGKYSNRFKIAGYKIFLDGSPQAKTAWLQEPYASGPDGYSGYGVYEDDSVIKYVEKSLDDNMQLQAHCNGDAAARQYLNAFDTVMKKRGVTNSNRSVLVHSQIVTEDEYTKMKELNIIPSLFIAHIYYWGDTHIINLGLDRASQISAAYTALSNDLKFTFHQDTPVIRPDMLETVWCAVNRITKNGEVLGENQRISAFDAFKAITINAAYQNGEENIKGTIEKGKLADFVILDRDPLETAPIDIKDIIVLETIKEGKTLYTHKE